MPIYKYVCKGCLHDFEQLQKMSDNKLPEKEPCPGCGEVGLVKQGVTQINITAGGGTNLKPPGDFKDLLKRMSKEAGKHSKIEY